MRHLSSLILTVLATLAPSSLLAQHDHSAMHGKPDSIGVSRTPTLPGQDAFGAIAEVVRILRADSATDWSRVDLERLRQHLVDMNDVTLRSRVTSVPVPGGVRLAVSGDGRARDAIQRMTAAHVHILEEQGLVGRVEKTATGVQFTVTARDSSDTRQVAQLRGLGFIGIMTIGEHHAAHHLAMARGEGGH
jgi:hypothetical protein